VRAAVILISVYVYTEGGLPFSVCAYVVSVKGEGIVVYTVPLLFCGDLIYFGVCDIAIRKENRKQSSCCSGQNVFDYHGIENALVGKMGSSNPFTPKRIIVIQLI
jgi:hypothetical protein